MMVQPVVALPNNSVEPLLDNTRDNSSGNLSMLDDIEKHYQPKNKQCSSDCCKRDSVESDLDHCDKSDEVNEKLMNSNHVGNEVTRASDFSVFGDEQAISVTDDELLEEKEETQTVNGRCGVSPAAVSDGSALVDLDHTYASVSPELSTDCGSADPEIMLLGDNLSRIWYDEDNNVMYIMSPSTSAEVETRESESCTDLDDVSELHFEANDVGVDNSQTACRPCVELAEPVTDKDGQSLSLSSNQISGDNREEYPSALMSPHDKQITDISTTISAVYPCRTLQASKGSVTFIKKGKTAENSLIGPTSVQPLERVVFSKKSSLLKDNMHVRLPPATLDLLCVEDLPTSLKSSKSLEDQQLSHKDVCQEAQKEKEHLLRQFRNDIPIRPPPKERVPVIYNSYGACLMKSCKSHESKHLSEGETNFLPPHLGLDEKHQNCEMDLSSDNLLTLYKRLQSTLDSLSLFNSYQNGCLDVYNPCGPFSCFGNPNLFYALNSIVSNRLKCSACSPQDMKCCTKASSNLQTSEKTKVVVEKTVANVNDHQQKVTSDKCLSEPPLNDKCHSELLKDKCEFEHVAQSHNGQVINKTKKKKKKKKRKNKSDSCDISINNSVINTTATTRMTCEASTVVRASNIKKASENNFAVKPSDVKKMPSFITSNVNSFTETKKSRRTKCLREKIKDCLKYGSDKKLLPKSLPVRRPTVPLVAFVPQKHQPQQQQKTEVNEMLEFLILPDSLKRPLSPFPGDPVSSVTKKQKVKEVNSLKPNCVQEVTAAKCLDSVHQDVVGQDNELCDEYKSDTPPEDVHHDAPVNFSPENTKETTSEQIDQLQDEFPESASTKNDDKTSQRNINSEEDTEIKSISAGLSTSVWSLSVSCKFLQEKNKTQEGTSVSDDGAYIYVEKYCVCLKQFHY